MDSIHQDLVQLEFLFGTWAGFGHGLYPTIDDFDYQETIRFEPGPGKPFLTYTQKTVRLGTGEPLHSEMGYLRSVAPGRVEWVLAHPTGIAEILTGSVEGTELRLMSGAIQLTPTAVEVADTERHIEVSAAGRAELNYRFSMAAVGQRHQLHLEATLHHPV